MCGSCSHECGQKCSKIVLLEPKVVLRGPSEPLLIPQLEIGQDQGFTVSHLCSHAKGCVKSVKVANISGKHTRPSDLRFSLVKDGTRVILEEFSCPPIGSSDPMNFDFGFADDGLDQGLLSFCNAPAGPVGGGKVYKPLERLSAFKGIPVEGVWTLRILDVFRGASGVLENWKLVIEYE